jgi:hypothetical protein
LSKALNVRFAVSGTAANDGTEFTPFLTGDLAFAAGQATVDVVITPASDGVVEGNEMLTLTVVDAVGYDLGASVAATVTISDPPLPVVTLTVPDPDASEVTLDPGAFRFTRTGDLTAGPRT